MGYRSLRVINEDAIEPGKGFGMHPHRSMEIFTFIKEGSLQHEDSMGNGRTIESGEFQYMSAGSGVLHSEVNPSPDQQVKLLQIWLKPKTPGGDPRYQDFRVAEVDREDGLALLASASGRTGSIEIRQDAEIYHGLLESSRSLDLSPSEDYPYTWLQLVRGDLSIGEQSLQAGDAAAFDHTAVKLTASSNSEFLLFRLS